MFLFKFIDEQYLKSSKSFSFWAIFENHKMNCYPVTDGTNLSRMSHTLKAPGKMFPVKENFKDKIKNQGQNFNCETCKTKKGHSKTFTSMSSSES